jgi:alpha/beta superfamily hydrolase
MPLLSRPEPATIVEDVEFRAGPYLLRGELAYPETGHALDAAVFAGPHPLLGGNMHNNVVQGVSDGFAQGGSITLRFDYRGVGRSQGPRIDLDRHLAEFWQTSHAPGEMDFWQDVQAAAEFVEQVAPGLPLTLVGYSFGCALLPSVSPQQDVAALVLIAPTVAKHDYNSFLSVKVPMLVVASDDDFATDAERLDSWFSRLSMPRELVRQRCDNHFFRGHEEWLVETIFRFLASQGR